MTYFTKTYRYLLLIFCLFLGAGSTFAQQEQADDLTAESVAEGDPAATAAADATPIPDAATAAVSPGEGDADLGAALWKANICGSCHAASMKDNMTGPALGGVQERWAGEPREHLYEWIQNSQKLIGSGKSARAIAVWNEWKPTVMSSYTNLSNDDVEHLLAYINAVYTGTYGPKGITVGPAVAENQESADNTWLFVILGGALVLLSLILARVTSNLQYMVETAEGTTPGTRRTLAQILTSRGMIAFVIFVVVVLGGYTTVNHAIDLGRQQDYQPEQPIKFSHEVHAGIHKIECQYCHDGARRSKHSVIPAVNTCMNCHRAINYGSQYGTAEITKIFAAIGWDPTEGAYIENYDQMTNEQAEKIYSKWIADKYISEGGDIDEVENVVEEQWEGIYAALTNEYTSDERVPGPIEWTRIHNLPDHAYFNHAQHVTVGKLKCQNCHGPVEEMEVVYQYSPLSMGWCINCHRETQVQFEDNDYYNSYQRYHEELKEGARDGVTVEDIGGLNCQRCHY
ncbi:c-type cytochrome [Neolewinella litorea]|uniref:C-type cytochrome n=1 Tax=Neolewinella litorea TaxID=2562452 RepID=A0A4V6S271_9BACT|nr:c-type cytochrome [Neolewinella litorea]THH41753.1 c-type cytochrome [Neolewinella litorea]